MFYQTGCLLGVNVGLAARWGLIASLIDIAAIAATQMLDSNVQTVLTGFGGSLC